ncbi:MAG TPA: arginine deiminase-related protein [Streptosporangiaceae bacterium]|nr:arginine deiminase-related protein [Streptosporangiaceae bacterium]
MTSHAQTHREPRTSTHARTYLMCPPDYFTVEYAINPWMNPDHPVDIGLATRQWERLRATYASLGHTVRIIDPEPGLPDMVFAANGATVIGGNVLGSRFKHPERHPEGAAYMNWFRLSGYQVFDPVHVNEGEGDIIYAGRVVIAGHGFRSEFEVSGEAEATFGLPVVSVRLVDPRFYHLDTAMIVLDENTAAYYPAAFDEAGQAALARNFPELIEAKDADAEALGLNGISDGRNVVLPVQAEGLARDITAAGFTVVPVDMSEFKKAGGGPKCCTLELR